MRAARKLLESPGDNPLPVRKAVGELWNAGQTDHLRDLLRGSSHALVRQLIIEEFGQHEDEAFGVLGDVLPLLMEPEGPLATSAQQFVTALHDSDSGAASLVQRLTETLQDETSPPEQVSGAAAAAGITCELRLLPALLARWEQDPTGAPRPVIIGALRKITMRNFGNDLAEWKRWSAENRATSREALLAQRVTELEGQVDESNRRLVEVQREVLRTARAQACVALLKDPLAAVRLLAVQRLERLLDAANGESDPTLTQPQVLEPVKERLTASLQPGPLAPTAEELRSLARVYATLNAGQNDARDLLLQVFRSRSDLASRQDFIEPLSIVLQRTPDVLVAGELRSLLQPASTPALRAAVLRALADLGDEASLPVVRQFCDSQQEPDEQVRREAVHAASAIAARSTDPKLAQEILGQWAGILDQDPSSMVIEQAGQEISVLAAKVPPEQRQPPFLALQKTIENQLQNEVLVDRLSSSLCSIPGRERQAVLVLADLLAKADPSNQNVPASLLTRLKELANRGMAPADLEPGWRALVRYLPKGGMTVEPAGRAEGPATQARLSIFERYKGAGEEAAMMEEMARLCLEQGRPAWAADLLADLLEQHGEALAGRSAALNWMRCRALLAVLERDDMPAAVRADGAGKAWDLLQAILAAPPEGVSRSELLRGELTVAAQQGIHVQDGAKAGVELLGLLPAGDPSRTEVARRTARLLLLSRDRQTAHDLLQKELPQASTPQDWILKARASRYSDQPEAVNHSLPLYQRVVGKHGEGGLVGAEHAEYVDLVLDLGELYAAAGDWAGAGSVLANVPSADGMTSGQRDRRSALEAGVAAAGGNSRDGSEKASESASGGDGAPLEGRS